MVHVRPLHSSEVLGKASGTVQNQQHISATWHSYCKTGIKIACNGCRCKLRVCAAEHFLTKMPALDLTDVIGCAMESQGLSLRFSKGKLRNSFMSEAVEVKHVSEDSEIDRTQKSEHAAKQLELRYLKHALTRELWFCSLRQEKYLSHTHSAADSQVAGMLPPVAS